jgi:hypothetical protein
VESYAKVVDVETVFLYGDLKKKIFMEIPVGMDAAKEECLSLNKTTHGMVQITSQFYVKLVKVNQELWLQRQ